MTAATHNPTPPNPVDRISLGEAKRRLREGFRDGTTCLCCGQRVKLYKRKLTSSMAYALVLIAKHYRTSNEWLHVPTYFSKLELDPKTQAAIRGDYAKLEAWGFLRERTGEENIAGGPRAGFWRITPAGEAFVRGETRAPRHRYFFNRRARGSSDERITITEALGDRFSYPELMTDT